MDCTFNKEEELWQWAVKDFADRELAPKELASFDKTFTKTVRKMGELGFLGVTLPEKFGGDPASWVMFGTLIEELARVNAGVAYFLLVHHQVSAALEAYGTDGQKERWLPGMVQGQTFACWAATEPDSGWDLDALTTRAEHETDQYRISGSKGPVSFGMAADIALTMVQDEISGPTAAVVPLDLSGIQRSMQPVIGLPLAAPAILQFDAVPVPKSHYIGEAGQGKTITAAVGPTSSISRIAIGLICLGMAQTALKEAIQYAKERQAFGQPIVKFQGLSQKIAEDATLVEAGKWLCYRALSLKDSGKDNAREAAMCGWWCPKISYQTIQNALLVHGHAGYSDDHPFGRMLKDVVGFEMISGSEFLLKTIISHRMAGPAGVPDPLLSLVGSY